MQFWSNIHFRDPQFKQISTHEKSNPTDLSLPKTSQLSNKLSQLVKKNKEKVQYQRQISKSTQIAVSPET